MRRKNPNLSRFGAGSQLGVLGGWCTDDSGAVSAHRGDAQDQQHTATARNTVHSQPSTKKLKASTAGFSAGLPSQNAIDAPTLAPRLREPTATGAVQQVHIMVGMDSSPPAERAGAAVGGERLGTVA